MYILIFCIVLNDRVIVAPEFPSYYRSTLQECEQAVVDNAESYLSILRSQGHEAIAICKPLKDK